MASQWSSWQPDDPDSDEDEIDESDDRVAPKEALLFCIEVTPSMLAPLPEASGNTSSDSQTTQSNALLGALDLVLSLMKRKIVTNNKDLVGVVLFNTEESLADDKGNDMDHLMILQSCEQVGIDSVQKLTKTVEKIRSDPKELERYRPWSGLADESEDGNKLAQCVDAGLSLLKTIRGTADGRMFLVTDNDDPYPASMANSRDARKTAFTRASDVREMNFRLDPIFINQAFSERDFDVNRFYKDYFINFGIDLSDESTLQSCLVHSSSADMFQTFKELFHHKIASRRALFTIPFIFGQGLEIGVQGFSLVTETKKGLAVQVDTSGRNVQLTKNVVTYEDKDNGQRLTKKDMRPYYPVGGKSDRGDPPHKVVFTDEEVRALKSLGLKPCLRLLGFTTLDRFPPEQQMKHSYFIYPYEGSVMHTGKAYAGSKRVFSSLLQTLAQKEKVGLGVFLPRATSTPVHVLIVPQEEVVENGQQIEPPGFHLLQLAFADDIRDNGLTQTTFCYQPDPNSDKVIGTEVVDTMADITHKLKLPSYQPDQFPNPVLNHHYNCLQAIALKEALPEAYDDTQPNYRAIKKRAGPLIERIKDEVASHPEAQRKASSSAAAGRKRKNEASASAESKPKKVKEEKSTAASAGGSATEDEDAATEDERIARCIRQGKSSQVKMPDLKAYSKRHGIKYNNVRKADLVEMITEQLQKAGEM